MADTESRAEQSRAAAAAAPTHVAQLLAHVDHVSLCLRWERRRGHFQSETRTREKSRVCVCVVSDLSARAVSRAGERGRERDRERQRARRESMCGETERGDTHTL